MSSTNTRSTTETGHAKNLAHFLQLISFCEGYAEVYNPTKESLKIPQLKTLYQEAQDHINATKTQKATFDKVTNLRKTAFINLKPLSTKIINAFAVSGADNLAINNIKSVNKKIQGKPAQPKTTNKNNDNTTITTISTSQQSYDKQVDHFINLLEILQQNEHYNPNEEELKVSTLKQKLEELQNANATIVNTYTAYNNAMLKRNFTLYNPLSGLVQIAKEVKQYIKSIYGATSPQFKKISALEFKIVKKD